MEKGDLVGPSMAYIYEIGASYKVVEMNGDRVVIEFICDLPIPPQSIAKTSELEVVARIKYDAKVEKIR